MHWFRLSPCRTPWSLHWLKIYNYYGEARARDYVNAGIARKSLDHAGTVKRNACFEFINIEIVKNMRDLSQLSEIALSITYITFVLDR